MRLRILFFFIGLTAPVVIIGFFVGRMVLWQQLGVVATWLLIAAALYFRAAPAEFEKTATKIVGSEAIRGLVYGLLVFMLLSAVGLFILPFVMLFTYKGG